MTDPTAPLILTLALDGTTFGRFDALRRRHFPPERNVVPAHVTLFHALPGDRKHDVVRELDAVCRQERRMPLTVSGLRNLGRGVAYLIESGPLHQLRRTLASEWREWLTPQDAQGYQPHITIQNKADPKEARRLLAELQAGFRPFEATGEGLLLWRYLGGPWEPVRRFTFAG